MIGLDFAARLERRLSEQGKCFIYCIARGVHDVVVGEGGALPPEFLESTGKDDAGESSGLQTLEAGSDPGSTHTAPEGESYEDSGSGSGDIFDAGRSAGATAVLGSSGDGSPPPLPSPSPPPGSVPGGSDDGSAPGGSSGEGPSPAGTSDSGGIISTIASLFSGIGSGVSSLFGALAGTTPGSDAVMANPDAALLAIQDAATNGQPISQSQLAYLAQAGYADGLAIQSVSPDGIGGAAQAGGGPPQTGYRSDSGSIVSLNQNGTFTEFDPVTLEVTWQGARGETPPPPALGGLDDLSNVSELDTAYAALFTGQPTASRPAYKTADGNTVAFGPDQSWIQIKTQGPNGVEVVNSGGPQDPPPAQQDIYAPSNDQEIYEPDQQQRLLKSKPASSASTDPNALDRLDGYTDAPTVYPRGNFFGGQVEPEENTPAQQTRAAFTDAGGKLRTLNAPTATPPGSPPANPPPVAYVPPPADLSSFQPPTGSDLQDYFRQLTAASVSLLATGGLPPPAPPPPADTGEENAEETQGLGAFAKGWGQAALERLLQGTSDPFPSLTSNPLVAAGFAGLDIADRARKYQAKGYGFFAANYVAANEVLNPVMQLLESGDAAINAPNDLEAGRRAFGVSTAAGAIAAAVGGLFEGAPASVETPPSPGVTPEVTVPTLPEVLDGPAAGFDLGALGKAAGQVLDALGERLFPNAGEWGLDPVAADGPALGGKLPSPEPPFIAAMGGDEIEGSGGLPDGEKPADTTAAGVGADSLSESQASNLSRFEKKLPAGAESTTITQSPDGSVTFTAEVPGRVPGSKAIYEKTVDASGDTVSYTKTTIAPDGRVVHVKQKFP